MPPRTDNDVMQRLSQGYREFSDCEAPGNTPLYEQLARAVADSEALLDHIFTLPRWQEFSTANPRGSPLSSRAVLLTVQIQESSHGE